MTPLHVALVDDEIDITRLLAGYLSAQGYRVTALHDGASLMRLMASDAPDLVLLDLGLPGEDGFAIARQLREHHRCGLVIVSGRGDAVDKVVGLEIGADDYVTKPFDLRELLARIKAVARRVVPAGEPQAAPSMRAPQAPGSPAAAPGAGGGDAVARERLRFAGWTLDLAARRLADAAGRDVALTAGEFDLLTVFAQHAGRVLSRDFLLERTRGRDAGPFDRTVDVLVARLRKKLEADAAEPRLLKSVRGAGYLLAVPVEAA